MGHWAEHALSRRSAPVRRGGHEAEKGHRKDDTLK